MKKFARKNQIIITALALLIAVAGYLNFTGQEINKNGLQSVSSNMKNELKGATAVRITDSPAEETEKKKSDKKDNVTDNQAEKVTTDISAEDNGGDYQVADNGELKSVSRENPGEAVMVSNALGSDYFSAAKLTREQNRAKNKETLMGIINNEKIASKDKKSAVDQVAELTENAELESAAEMMLQAKGFEDAVVSIEKGSADVIVNAKALTEQQMAQIGDIVSRKTEIPAEKIVITPVEVKDH